MIDNSNLQKKSHKMNSIFIFFTKNNKMRGYSYINLFTQQKKENFFPTFQGLGFYKSYSQYNSHKNNFILPTYRINNEDLDPIFLNNLENLVNSDKIFAYNTKHHDYSIEQDQLVRYLIALIALVSGWFGGSYLAINLDHLLYPPQTVKFIDLTVYIDEFGSFSSGNQFLDDFLDFYFEYFDDLGVDFLWDEFQNELDTVKLSLPLNQNIMDNFYNYSSNLEDSISHIESKSIYQVYIEFLKDNFFFFNFLNNIFK